MEHPCGRCLSCRINRRRLWATRLVLESCQHKFSWFVTLTYAPEHLPQGGNLVPRDLTLFLKRLRKNTGKLRYFACGEYGTRYLRPHYHLAIFGLQDHREVGKAWTLGYVHIGQITAASAAYMTGYLTKGWTNKEDPRLKGKHPEFSRMSLNPGIGALSIPSIAATLRAHPEFVVQSGDVLKQIRFGGKKQYLGRYLIGKLRVALGRPVDMPELLRGVAQLNFASKLKEVDAWAAHQAAKQTSRWQAESIAARQRAKARL